MRCAKTGLNKTLTGAAFSGVTEAVSARMAHPWLPQAQKIPDLQGATSPGRPNCIRTARLSGGPECRTANYVLRARHGIGPPHPNGVDGRSGGAVSENGMDVSEEETSRARNAVAA